MATETVDWSGLPPELLRDIAANLLTLIDYIRLRAVCKTWCIGACVAPREFPWLVVKLNRSYNPLTKTRQRFTISRTPNSCRAVGSFRGYLVIIQTNSIFVLNPLTKDKIVLPPLSSFPDMKFDSETEVRKIVLSHCPKEESKFFAFAILTGCGKLAYCQNGDYSWKIVHQMSNYYVKEAVYFNGALYVLCNDGSVATCEVNDADSPIVKFIAIVNKETTFVQCLVDGMGELLLLSQYFSYGYAYYNSDLCIEDREFRVFRLDLTERKWVKVTSLDDMVLFVGEGSTFALSARDYPGCKGNRIYFYRNDVDLPDTTYSRHYVGIYDMEVGTISDVTVGYSGRHCPMWITPSVS